MKIKLTVVIVQLMKEIKINEDLFKGEENLDELDQIINDDEEENNDTTNNNKEDAKDE